MAFFGDLGHHAFDRLNQIAVDTTVTENMEKLLLHNHSEQQDQ
jgi:hypothetical protein